MPANFPFTAVIGQSQMKLALLLCAIDPAIGGVLLSGGRGSAKSTLVRSLTALLPNRTLATIPLGATEEMVTGSIQLEQALKDGAVEFNPGVLARAHQGLLYVDEVNLLPDHLVDLLLDVSASKMNLIERDGLSNDHPADFVLVGTMNPDEGELRPQLLDRFGLMAEVQSRFNLIERQQIVEQRLAYDRNPDELIAMHADALGQLSEQIQQAIKSLPTISIPENIKTEIANRCNRAGVEGLRADITLYRAAIAHAAFLAAAEVSVSDLEIPLLPISQVVPALKVHGVQWRHNRFPVLIRYRLVRSSQRTSRSSISCPTHEPALEQLVSTPPKDLSLEALLSESQIGFEP